jgi:tRNA-specific 2-thiouridylase
MQKVKLKNKIVVAMSGGVDSSVTAVLLKKQGFDVTGIMMKFWKDGVISDNRCCSLESEKLARLVAKKIGIPFYVVNVEKEFKKKVVDYFLQEYKNGKTPNPCVVCNKEIKFGFLINKALSLGADFVATGHYARTSLGSEFSARQSNFPAAQTSPLGVSPRLGKFIGSLHNSLTRLFIGKDKNKDQSYFLWQLNQKQLSHVLFPVGNYTKPEVRKLARKFNLPTAETPESQEVCFVSGTTNDFLKKYLKIKPGNIIDTNGKKVGLHDGLYFYTIGQRKGINVQQGPWYVIGKNFKNNTLIISKDQKDLLQKELIARDVSWISDKEVKTPLNVEVKIRYKSDFAKAIIYKLNNKKVKIIFKKKQKSITSGQSAVFYKGEELLGGGIIN